MRTRIVIVLIAMFTAVPGCMRLGPPLSPDEMTAETMSHLTPEQRAALRSAPGICFQMPGWLLGSGTLVAPDRMVISDHQVVDALSPIRFHLHEYTGTLIARGSRENGGTDDWAVLALDPPYAGDDYRILEVDTDRPLRAGDEVYLAGNWMGHLPEEGAQLRFGPAFARLVVSPEQRESRVLICSMPSQEHLILLHGFSGSPALVWDDLKNDFVIIGIAVQGGDQGRGPWYAICRFPMRLLAVEPERNGGQCPPYGRTPFERPAHHGSHRCVTNPNGPVGWAPPTMAHTDA